MDHENDSAARSAFTPFSKRGPNIALPTRTDVLPNIIAASKSSDIPIESSKSSSFSFVSSQNLERSV